jgi:O-antigen/teichoic acid export membrane protein
MTRKVVTSLVWRGWASLVGQALSSLSTLLVIRILAPADYGLMAIGSLVISFIMLVADVGVSAAVVQAPELKRPQLQALFSVAFLSYVLGAGAAFASAPLMAAFFAEPRLVPILRALSLNFVFAGLYAVPQALLRRTLEFGSTAKVDVLATLVSSTLVCALALGGLGVWALVGATLATHVFRAIAFQIVRPCLFLQFPAFADVRGMVHFGGLVTLSRILWFGYTSIDVAVAGRVLGGALVGVYSVALALASSPLDKVMPIVTEVSFSALSRAQGDLGLVRRGVLRSLELVSLLAFPVFLGMAAVGPEAIAVLLGPKWTAAVIPFQILCVVFPFRALGFLFAPALYAIGRPRVVVGNNAITLGGMMVALVAGVQWGVVGLSAGWLAGYVPVFCVIAARSLATLQIPVGRALARVAPPLAGALLMCVGVLAARTLVGGTVHPAATLAGLSLLGAGIYGSVIAAFRFCGSGSFGK